MKKLTAILLLLCLAVLPAAGCFAADQTLNVINWGSYIDMQVIYDFEKAFNCRVNYDTFTSNEDLYLKMKANSYDVIIPSDYMVERLIAEERLQPLDKSIVTNLDQLLELDILRNPDYDPGNTYSAPYFWQNVGICYNTTKVDPAKVEELGWEIFRDPELDGHVWYYDSERDGFMVPLKALGYSMNTEDEAEINAAYEWLREMDKAVHPSYATDEMIDGMANGEKWVALMYSGDIAYVLTMNEDMAFCAPSQGTNIAVDAMAIPTDAKNPELANQFIDFILDYPNSVRISTEVCYTSPNAQAFEELSGPGGDLEGNDAYIPRSGYDKDEFFHDHKESLRKDFSEKWIKVKLHE